MILANLFYKCCEFLSMLANAVANLTNVLQMKRKYKTWVSNAKYTLRVCLFVLYLPGPVHFA